jgi:LPS sulfotransferase NodH
VPRSGSWFLCGLLASTGVLGTPRQFFWQPEEREVRARHGLRSDAEYLEWVLTRGTTANGSFASKFELEELKDVVGRLRQRDDGSEAELLARAFPSPSYVWLRREDTVAQAVSWARAIQTNQWRSSAPPGGEPSFDPEQIGGLVELIRWETDAWAGWFAAQEIAPLRVTYEELQSDRRRTLERIAEFAGVTLPPEVELRPYPGYEPQADGLNDEWANRYRAGVDAT